MYDEALVKANLVTLSDRRQVLTDKLFKKIFGNKDSKLRNLLTPQNAKHYNLRKGRQFNPFFFKTNRFPNNFFVFNALKVTRVNLFLFLAELRRPEGPPSGAP